MYPRQIPSGGRNGQPPGLLPIGVNPLFGQRFLQACKVCATCGPLGAVVDHVPRDMTPPGATAWSRCFKCLAYWETDATGHVVARATTPQDVQSVKEVLDAGQLGDPDHQG